MQTWWHVVEWRSTSDPDQVAIRDDRQVLTYRELRERCEQRAGGWYDAGVRSGDVVAILAANSAEFLCQVLGLHRLGAIPLLLNWRMTQFEVTRLLTMTSPRAVFADGPRRALVSDDFAGVRVHDGAAGGGWLGASELTGAAPERPVDRLMPDEVSLLMHTSGTTGDPKVIPLDHGSLIRTLSGFAIDIGTQVRGSRHLIMMPMFHLAGFAQAMQCMLTGGTLLIHDGFDVDRVIDAIAEHRVNFFTAAPAIIEVLVQALEGDRTGADVSSLVEVQYGAAPIDPQLLERAVATVCTRFRQIYGSTELQGFLTVLRPEDHVAGSTRLQTAGQVALGWEARVVSADGLPRTHGESGELQVRGAYLFRGYWGSPTETAAAFTVDGWYRTGDQARLSEDGYVQIVGRVKDMIVSGGENIYPAEIEQALLALDGVLEVAVVAGPHHRWGETPVAFVVLSDDGGPTVDQMRAHCRERLAGFKCPSEFISVAELPRNTLGKVLKTTLRARASGAAVT